MSSSQSLEACVIKTLMLNKISSAKSRSLTLSIAFCVQPAKPSSLATIVLSILCGVPARAAEPSGLRLFLSYELTNRSKSLLNINA